MDYLIHHGIKGQKWGVRRFQNKDGTLTSEGQRHRLQRNRTIRAAKTKQSVEDIVSTMSKVERSKLGLDDDQKEYSTFEEGAYLAKRVIKSSGNTPVAFFDLFDYDDDGTLYAFVGTRSGDEYRGHGYATRAAKEGMKWYDANKDRLGMKQVIWDVRIDNTASRKIANKLDFKLDKNSYSKDKKWVNYVRR